MLCFMYFLVPQKMNIPNHFDIEEKLLSDKNSRCNKFLLKLYYLVVCFLRSFVLIALTITIITILFKQIGVEIEIGELMEYIFIYNKINSTDPLRGDKTRPNDIVYVK